MLGKRLHLAALLNRKLAQMPFQLTEPVWIETDDGQNRTCACASSVP
jgi:diacylglycerol O-acyltransferase